MNFRTESSKSPRKQSEEDESYDELKGAAAAIATVAGVAGLAAWGISKLIGGNTEEKPRASGSALYRLEQAYPQMIQPTKKWKKPKRGFYKLNTDASLNISGEAFGGGLIRDHTGEWKGGFIIKLEMCDGDSTWAEIDSLRAGVSYARRRLGIKKIEVETDSEQAVNYITDPEYFDPETHKYGRIVKKCWELRDHNEWKSNFKILHVEKDMNKCADLLARLAREMTSTSYIFDDPPDNVQLRNQLQKDQDN